MIKSDGITERKAIRRVLFVILGGTILIGGAVWFIYWALAGSRYVTTEDAYVQALVAEVIAQTTGPVLEAPVQDTFHVRKGQVVAIFDPKEFEIAVKRAKAELDQVERRVGQYYANDIALGTEARALAIEVDRAQAQFAAAKAEFDRAEVASARRRVLSESGAISLDDLREAVGRTEVAKAHMNAAMAAALQAQANVSLAVERRSAAAVLIDGANVRNHPEVAIARANLEQAELNLARTVVRSPIDGVVAQHDFVIGQRIEAGTRLMSVVPIQSAYVDANFKEGQLENIRIGSPVTLTSDIYGPSVIYHGTVTGVAAGSGSAFALIPAQNATGSWTKVIQRVPVRIQLNSEELERHPLRVGLSMKAVVAVSR